MADRFGSSKEKSYRSRNRAIAALVQSTSNVVATDIDGLDSAATIALINSTSTGLDSAQVLSIAGGAGLDSAAVLSIALSGYGERKTFIQSSAPSSDFAVGDFWWDRDNNDLYKATASTTFTSHPLPAGTMSQWPGLALDSRGNHLTKNPGAVSATFNVAGGPTGSFPQTGDFATHGGTYPWEPFDASNTGVYYQLTTPTTLWGFYNGNIDAGWLYRIEYENGDYAVSNNASPIAEPSSLTWYDASDTPLGQTKNYTNGMNDFRHPSGVKCSAFVVARGSYGTRWYDFWIFFQGADFWNEVGDMYLDSDTVRSYVTADHVNSLGITAGLDSAAVTSLIDSSYINARIDPFDSSHVLNLVDSAYIQLRDRFQDSSGIIAIVDSAYVQARQTSGGGGTDSAGVTTLIDSDYILGKKFVPGDAERRIDIRDTEPSIQHAIGDYWLDRNNETLYKLSASNTWSSTFPAYTYTGYPNLSTFDFGSHTTSSSRSFDISGGPTGTFTATWKTGGTTGNYTGFEATFNNPVIFGYYYIGNTVAGWVHRVDYEDGSYAQSNQSNARNQPDSITWYEANGTAMSGADAKTFNVPNSGAQTQNWLHPRGTKAVSLVYGRGTYGTRNYDAYLLFNGDNFYQRIGEIFDPLSVSSNLVPSADSTYSLGDSDKQWKDLFLSGNTITLGGSTISKTNDGGISVKDSQGNSAPITGSNIFDSAKIQGFIDSAYINARVDPFDSSHVINLVDSAYIALRDRFQDSSGIIAIVDSAYVQARQTAGGGGVDSAATISLIDARLDSVGPSRSFTYTYTATASQTTFSGADNNNNILAYSAGNIMTFLNGILLVDSDDYVATNGNSIVLNSAANLNDILNVVKFRATGSGGNLSHQQFRYTVSAPTTTFSGNDDNGNALSYETGELQVFLNGILLIDSQDYTASNGTSVVLTAATDSNDVLAISKYIGGGSGGGTVDSADIIAIVDSAYVAARGGGGSGDAFRATHFVYTTATPTTTITGADDNSATLSYIENQIQVYRNGILLIDSADYTATNGTSITLGTTTDSNDTVVITAFRGVISGGLDSAAVISLADATRIKNYVYTTASPTTTITGTDDNGATLSYVANKIQVYQNGILLIDSADYTATNETSIILGIATDSGDTIVVSTFRGSRGTLDSATVTSIIDSAYVAARSAGGGTDSATVISLSGELKGGMFRINPQSLSINTTIDSNENAHVAGPISFDSGVVLTINGNLVIS